MAVSFYQPHSAMWIQAQTNEELNLIWVITLSHEYGKLKRAKGFE